ncbi:hypothetical protein [Myroides sp. TSA_177.3]|uniref:hypothetical protein n=1 Tax=Myroides sp. TSA_177.3 TaxID=3415650 RepID=UPI0040461DB5
MARMKIWAYGKNKLTNEYINDDFQNRKKTFFIWEALKIKKNNNSYYKNIVFLSTQSDESKRQVMEAVKLGFFRYSNKGQRDDYTGSEESLSHMIAIHALSELDKLNFIIGKEKLTIVPEDISTEDVKVQFDNGNYYIADLICTYKEPQKLIEKWGNKIALEVKVSHGCEPTKVKDFQDFNYPLIEITLKRNMQFLKEINKEEFNEDDIENYYLFLKRTFSKTIYGKILSNHVIVDRGKGVVNCEERLAIEQKMTLEMKRDFESKLDVLEFEKESAIRENKLLRKENELLIKEKRKVLQEINTLKNQSLLKKIIALFK